MIKLNLGCACRPLEGYVNIDIDSREDMVKRYPELVIPDIRIYKYDIFNLPYKDGEIDEVLCDCLLEHLSFKEERLIWHEVSRVLKVGGVFKFSVPDFDYIVSKWQSATDNWLDFFRDDEGAIKQNHWFGQYSYSLNNKWGYLTASIFGSQNGEGQYHKNAYTKNKIIAICKKMRFSNPSINTTKWKNREEDILNVETIKQ